MVQKTFKPIFNNDFECSKIVALKIDWKCKNYSFLKTSRPQYGILLILDGCIEFRFHSEIVTVNAGDIIYLPEKSFYNAVFVKATSGILINFNAPKALYDFSSPTVLLSDCLNKYFPYFNNTVKSDYGEICTSLLVKSEFYKLLYILTLELQYQTSPVESKTVTQIIRLLINAPEMSIPEIAHSCGISESSLRRIFKSCLGKSPIQYRTEEKIRRAKQLLLSTANSPKEICYHLGFYDEAYFYKVFFRYVKMTPNQYRASHSPII